MRPALFKCGRPCSNEAGLVQMRPIFGLVQMRPKIKWGRNIYNNNNLTKIFAHLLKLTNNKNELKVRSCNGYEFDGYCLRVEFVSRCKYANHWRNQRPGDDLLVTRWNFIPEKQKLLSIFYLEITEKLSIL